MGSMVGMSCYLTRAIVTNCYQFGLDIGPKSLNMLNIYDIVHIFRKFGPSVPSIDLIYFVVGDLDQLTAKSVGDQGNCNEIVIHPNSWAN